MRVYSKYAIIISPSPVGQRRTLDYTHFKVCSGECVLTHFHYCQTIGINTLLSQKIYRWHFDKTRKHQEISEAAHVYGSYDYFTLLIRLDTVNISPINWSCRSYIEIFFTGQCPFFQRFDNHEKTVCKMGLGQYICTHNYVDLY